MLDNPTLKVVLSGLSILFIVWLNLEIGAFDIGYLPLFLCSLGIICILSRSIYLEFQDENENE